MHAHKHIMLSIVWLEYFYSPQSKSGVTIFKDIKTKRARDLKWIGQIINGVFVLGYSFQICSTFSFNVFEICDAT